MKLYNHLNSPVWSEKNQAKKLVNGAKRYSEVITKYYFPVFQEVLKDDPNTVVITVTTENVPQTFKEYKRIFLFLHECRYRQQPTIARCRNFVEANPQAEVWFIVWEQDTAKVISERGMNAIYLPMAIDLDEINAFKTDTPKLDKIIWFGNIRQAKKPFFKYFMEQCNRHGIRMDYISNSNFNGTYPLNRQQILATLQNYKYGVGVGICAHEMSALGLKVFIYSYNWYCNCAYNKEQGRELISKNLCSPETAHITVPDALRSRELMTVIDPVDIKDNAKLLKRILTEKFSTSS